MISKVLCILAVGLLVGCERVKEPTDTFPSSLRVATFNVALSDTGDLLQALASPDSMPRAAEIAQIIQINDPDVLLLNEFDYEVTGVAIDRFRKNYLEVSQNGERPVVYPYAYFAPVNTGVHSGFDLDNNGVVVDEWGSGAYADDAFGYGLYPGQYGMALLSKYPIDFENVRTFQKFLWKDMPGNLLPPDPLDSDRNGDLTHFFTAAERAVFRLSSKSHWDIPILIGETRIHMLCAHPTPPTFDDGTETDLLNPTLVDDNGRRNHDEIRFWADYITHQSYIYDDQGHSGGLEEAAHFFILGDYNADDDEGDSTDKPASKFLTGNRSINNTLIPEGEAGPAPSDTAGFSGGMRIDYALPSRELKILDAAVYWPAGTDLFMASDHRMVWVEVAL